MNGIYEVSCEKDTEIFEAFIKAPKAEKAKIIAIAVLKRGAASAVGITHESLYDGTMKANDVIGKVRELVLLDKGNFLPKGSVFIARPKPEELRENQIFGLRPEANPTGEVKITLNGTYRNYYSTQTVRWFNQLRENREQYDLIYWTENYVHLVLGNDVMFMGIGSEISGSENDSIYGTFSAMYYNDGEDVPYGKINSNLLENYTTLTIVEPVVPSGGTAVFTKDACVGGCTMYRATGATINATLQFDIAETTSCVEWKLFKDCGRNMVEATDAVQIDSAGLMTITGMVPGTHKYKVVAITNSGVPGEFCISFVTKPA